MFAEQHAKVVRVGIRLIVAAALAGLFVLLLAGQATAAEEPTLDDAELLLLEPAIPTAEDRLAAAERELSEARHKRSRRLLGRVLETGWKAWASSDPRRAARAALEAGSEFWSWGRRDAAEDRALDLLERELAYVSPSRSEAFRELHTQLTDRATEERVRDLLSSADAALDAGHVLLARARIERALALEPDSERAAALALRLDAQRGRIHVSSEGLGSPDVAVADTDLATALLLGDYDRALSLAPAGPQGELARTAALYLSGDATAAAVELESLAERDDGVGVTARAWSERPELSSPRRFESERRRYRVQHALGLIGGETLAEDGLDLSRRGLSAWRQSLSPLNLALSVPTRFVRGWTPDDSSLRNAALSCMQHHAGTGLCSRAEDWLEDEPAAASEIPLESTSDVQAWQGGALVLPTARTLFAPLAPRPLVLTRDALHSEFLPALDVLRDALGDADAVILRPEDDAVPAPTLSEDDALLLLGEATRAIESNGLAPLTVRRNTLLEGLRRLDGAVRRGARLVVVPMNVQASSLRDATLVAVLDGGRSDGASLTVSRSGDDITVVRDFATADFACPEDAICMDRRTWWRAGLYSSVDTDADARFGARADLYSARVAVEMRTSGPNAMLVVPVARWLGVERWIPVAAQVAVGTEGVYVGPVLLD